MLGFKGKNNNFSIDDAFETEDDDFVKTYGATTENAPLKPNGTSLMPKSECVVRIDDPVKEQRSRLARLKGQDDSFSKDSDSLIQGDSFHSEKFDTKMLWWKHPKVRENWKVMLAAFGLLIIGIGMLRYHGSMDTYSIGLLVTGVIVLISPEMGVQSFVFFIAGAICFIPGAYHVVYAYCAVKGKRGYNFHNLPLFN